MTNEELITELQSNISALAAERDAANERAATAERSLNENNDNWNVAQDTLRNEMQQRINWLEGQIEANTSQPLRECQIERDSLRSTATSYTDVSAALEAKTAELATLQQEFNDYKERNIQQAQA